MRRHSHPAQPSNPYPDAGTSIAGFRYDSALVLLRLQNAVQLRTGEDADYLTGRPYLFSWHPPGEDWRQVVVPAGLITDLTSVPRPMRFIIGRVGPWLEAAILHDYLYIAWQDVEGKEPTAADRTFADDMMRAAMREAGVGRWAIWAIHLSVRLFGRSTFDGRNADRYVDLDDPDVRRQIAVRVPRLP